MTGDDEIREIGSFANDPEQEMLKTADCHHEGIHWPSTQAFFRHDFMATKHHEKSVMDRRCDIAAMLWHSFQKIASACAQHKSSRVNQNVLLFCDFFLERVEGSARICSIGAGPAKALLSCALPLNDLRRSPHGGE